MNTDVAGTETGGRLLWIDATLGVAGDMLLAALLDAGAALDIVRRDIDAVLPDTVSVELSQVERAGIRAAKVDVTLLRRNQPHRRWRDIRDRLHGASLPPRVRDRALAVFNALAHAEARVHGMEVDDVHFHEVGAWDSIADIVGICSALEDLRVEELRTGDITVGSGTIRADHGVLPVPVPAVLELLTAARYPWQRIPPDGPPGTTGELATPTGVATLVTLASHDPRGEIGGSPVSSGVGAGTTRRPLWPNVVRVALIDLEPRPDPGARAPAPDDVLTEELAALSTNVDDLDPRLWPDVLAGLLGLGARDAWLTPIVGKKGRPAHVLSVLVDDDHLDAARDHVFATTGTLGVREERVRRTSLRRETVTVPVECGSERAGIPVKVGLRRAVIVHATPEFDDVADLARRAGRPVLETLDLARAAAESAGLRPGLSLPPPGGH